MNSVKSPAGLEGLPQELKDLIVDYIARIPDETERKDTLRATALVSRRFRYGPTSTFFQPSFSRDDMASLPERSSLACASSRP
jgi:hypothetical protein